MNPAMPSEQTTGGEPRQVVVSPEQVTLHLPIAGPTSRMMAYGVDYVLVVLLEIGVIIALILTTPMLDWLRGPAQRLAEEASNSRSGSPISADFIAMIAIILLFGLVVEFAYFTFFELTTGGRSPGKMAIGLRVVRDGGLPLSPQASFVRNILRTVDALPMNYTIGLIAMIVSNEGKRLGDLAAGTVVVRHDRPPPAPPLPAVDPAATASFRFDRSQVERLGADELALIRLTLRRLETMPPEQVATALGRAAEVLRERIGYAPIGASDREGFLRALLAAAARR